MLQDFGKKAVKAMQVLENGFSDCRVGVAETLPKRFQEIRRRERVIRIFPNKDSVVRPSLLEHGGIQETASGSVKARKSSDVHRIASPSTLIAIDRCFERNVKSTSAAEGEPLTNRRNTVYLPKEERGARYHKKGGEFS